jgi:hypothetical protein
MNPRITQIAAESHIDDLLREAGHERYSVSFTGRARRLLRRRRRALQNAPRVATA